MKSLHIQLQPSLAPGLDAVSEADRLRNLIGSSGLAGSISVTEGEDNGPYINIDFDTVDVVAMWSLLRPEWQTNCSLAACTIVCCEGDAGWDDYRLLHHFDSSQPLDEAA